VGAAVLVDVAGRAEGEGLVTRLIFAVLVVMLLFIAATTAIDIMTW
jgi:hypothetical protein